MLIVRGGYAGWRCGSRRARRAAAPRAVRHRVRPQLLPFAPAHRGSAGNGGAARIRGVCNLAGCSGTRFAWSKTPGRQPEPQARLIRCRGRTGGAERLAVEEVLPSRPLQRTSATRCRRRWCSHPTRRSARMDSLASPSRPACRRAATTTPRAARGPWRACRVLGPRRVGGRLPPARRAGPEARALRVGCRRSVPALAEQELVGAISDDRRGSPPASTRS